MGVERGEYSVSAMKLLDRERLMKAIYAFSGRSKKIRKEKKKRNKEDNIKKNKVKTGATVQDLFDEIEEIPIDQGNLEIDLSKTKLGLREAGWSNRRIGRHLGRSDMVVARCWQQWVTEGRVYRRGGSGRPRNTNDREDRAIRRVATSAPTTSLASIQRHFTSFQTSSAIKRTIRRRLTEVGLRSRRPLRRLPLTPHHRQCRLDFCRPRATWSVTDWRRVSSSVMNPIQSQC
ncbi:HTH_Tnp_Tc3_2 domain-containing protein [Trichonephila clavipes]|nr:HTH_Tnp_Tc3_2 domain-containing protein [Trichonephila clavipes]